MKSKKFKKYLNEGVFSSFAALNFALKLAKPFDQWDAFKKKIIDKDGKIIDKSTKLEIFDNLIRKIKILMHKFVPNKKYLTLLISMYLLKKEDNIQNDMNDILKEQIDKQLSDEEISMLKKFLNEIVKLESESFFVGKNLSNEEARKIGIKKIKYDHRGFAYNPKTGFCKFV